MFLVHQIANIQQAGLSWGSVQAETVRLQRQSDPGFWVQNNFGSKKFLSPNKFWVQKNLGSKKILVQKNFGSKKDFNKNFEYD